MVHYVHVTNGIHAFECPTLTIQFFIGLFGFPEATRPEPEAAFLLLYLFCLTFSCLFHVFVLLAQDGHLIFEQYRVQTKLRVDQRHVAKPVGEGIDALLPLVEVLQVGPGDAL